VPAILALGVALLLVASAHYLRLTPMPTVFIGLREVSNTERGTTRGHVSVRNIGRRRCHGLVLRCRVGQQELVLDVPCLHGGTELGQMFEIAGAKDTGVPMGPGELRMTDPLGLITRRCRVEMAEAGDVPAFRAMIGRGPLQEDRQLPAQDVPGPSATDRRAGRARDHVCLVLCLLLLGMTLANWGDLYEEQGYLAAGSIAVLVAGGLALVGHLRSWGPMRSSLGIVLVHLLAVTYLYAPPLSFAEIRPTGTRIIAALSACTTIWAKAADGDLPWHEHDGHLLVIWITTVLLGSLACRLALRASTRMAAWGLALCLGLVPVALGSSGPAHPYLLACLFTALTSLYCRVHTLGMERLDGPRPRGSFAVEPFDAPSTQGAAR
jgi:hypothetical protein